MDAADYQYAEQECMSRLAQRLKWEEIPDHVWGHVVKLGLPYSAITGGADEWAELEQEARSRLAMSPLHTNEPTGDSIEDDSTEDAADYLSVTLEAPEKRRAEAYAAFVARWISSYQDVWGFRESVLGGEKLVPEQAYNFLTSPAVRCLSPEAIRSIGAPLFTHEAEVVNSELVGGPTDPYLRLDIGLNPPGDVLTVEYVPREAALPGNQAIRIPLVFDSGENSRAKGLGSWPLAYRDSDGKKRTAHPWPGSALMKLRDAAIRLSRLLGWDQEHAVWLLLTGEPPYLNPFRLKLGYSRGKPMTVKMEVAAWMPVEQVARLFRRIQQETLTAGSKRLPPRSLEVCAFVENHIQDAPDRSVWPYLCDRWNAAHPGEAYKNWRTFRQTYHRNMPTVLQRYEYPRPSPNVQEEGRRAREAMAETLENQINAGHTEFTEVPYDWNGNELTATRQLPGETSANNGDDH